MIHLQPRTATAPALAVGLPHGLDRPRAATTTVTSKRDLRGTYARLIAAAVLANVSVLYLYLVYHGFGDPNLPACLATANIFVAILVRNEIFLNGCYRILVGMCSPSTVPLRIKHSVTSTLLHIGGLHAGCAVASLVWLTVAMVQSASNGAVDRPWLVPFFCGSLLLLLSVMCIVSLPPVRDCSHDLFEYAHRFLGWSCLLLLWGYALLSINWSEAADAGLLGLTPRNVTVWLTVAISVLIVAPWLTVRKVRVEARVQSPSIVEITFPGGSQPGMFGRISRGLLADWHAFAVVSGETIRGSHMMVISGVGDFTRRLIAMPPKTLCTRMLRFPGLPYCVPMYRRSVIIATGAGMAPYLSLLPSLPRGRHRLVWVGRSFRECFGDRLYEMAHDWPDLVLIDTAVSGRPDMTALAVEHYRSFGADVVFVGSNPEGTAQIVSGCRALGIPAFGPSWDS